MVAPKSSWPRRLLLSLLRIYLWLLVVLVVFQRQLLYVPSKMPMSNAVSLAAENGLRPWLNRSGEIMGWEVPSAVTATGGVLIVHGNGGSALDRAGLASDIHVTAALDVYILEYPGYGPRGGTPNETSLLAAADEALENLPTNRPVYVVSESLGTGVAAHLAQKYPARVSGLVMFVPYDRLASVAQSHYPVLPVYYLLRDRFAPVDWLKDYRGPVKIIIAGADEIIPPERGQKLYDGYPGPKSLQIIPGAHHNETISQSPQWWRATLSFLQSVHEH